MLINYTFNEETATELAGTEFEGPFDCVTVRLYKCFEISDEENYGETKKVCRTVAFVVTEDYVDHIEMRSAFSSYIEAREYFEFIRKKLFGSAPIIYLESIPYKTSSQLFYAGLKTLADINSATDARLLAIKGIGPASLKKLRNSISDLQTKLLYSDE
ncbi:hypothetical protein [Dickeya undicola]|uniref:RNA polymerase alpha subunit C-terminal domain-containing protein n=1 Tax=Dickeya undicola TaxID=1577887 RepID=A0A3N0G5K1_9GAMM|nr:hypothetical protein [Dickeya undicola]RNM07714.1 hypothetical protein EF878_07195 [Dickeya undicola]